MKGKRRQPSAAFKAQVALAAVKGDKTVNDCQVLSEGGERLRTYRAHRASHVWTRRKSGWILIFTQDSGLPGGD